MEDRVPLTVEGKQVGWAWEADGKLEFEITDQDTLKWLSTEMTKGLSIED